MKVTKNKLAWFSLTLILLGGGLTAYSKLVRPCFILWRSCQACQRLAEFREGLHPEA